ncbi:uncharacterized protein LOC119338704 [Triticum dicoccoides]|uniref:uncharacterized protein LOC119338704 n=1 Tax=Triticum dicoccoides TaxID=85692 RepID=UPI0018913D2C|nr:uncharacterized protein LOC119338704 [Triticum dicoccoides]XP_044429632.1 uncharacterized protein LOC123155541 [Triticum aestivum]
MAATKKPKAKPQKPAKVTAARIAKMLAEGDEMIRNMTPEERARIIAESMAEKSAREAAEAKDEAGDDEEETAPAQCEEEWFAAKFRSMWRRYLAPGGVTFDQTSKLPAMRYVNPASGCSAKAMDTLQIMSVKVAAINGGLHWPLQVFGIVAARDYLDRKRNIIFHRPRTDCQTITQEDCYLALSGPSRAIVVSYDPTYVEVSLKVKGAIESEDKDLSALIVVFRAGACPQNVYPSRLSTLEMNFDHIYQSVEATVFIRIIGGSWPDGFRGVFSAASSRDDTLQVKLLEFEDGRLPADSNGVIALTRRVVSVALQRNLKVSVMAFPRNVGYAAETSEAVLQPHRAGVSPPGVNLCVGSCSMEVRVAWSCFCCEC